MSQKTSTAAVDSFGEGRLPNRRRAPRHPASGTERSHEAKKQRSKEKTREEAREIGQARIAVREEKVMSGNGVNGMARKIRVILPVILRITFCVAMWTLGAMTMMVAEADAQTRDHRVVKELPVDRARVENLQRWVDAGHDAWCRNPQLVAAMTLRRVAPEFANYDFELASLAGGDGKVSPDKAMYSFHSIDGHATYRITLRRFGWQNKTAGSPQNRIWIPVRSEKIRSDSLD
jgi:hypothetical protein